MRAVILTKDDTCVTYALKRVGINLSIKYASELNNYFEFIPFQKNLATKGTIICWNKRAFISNLTTEITEDGILINHSYIVNEHIAVIEDLNIETASDCIKKGNPNSIPSINIMKLSECREPDFILTIKK